MDFEFWRWGLRTLAKFALLGAPAIALLLWWRRKGAASTTIYRLTWANTLGFLVWLIAVTFTASLSHFERFSWLNFSIFPALVYFFWPALATIGSLVLCLLFAKSEPNEKTFVAVPNLFMLILWITSIAPPN